LPLSSISLHCRIFLLLGIILTKGVKFDAEKNKSLKCFSGESNQLLGRKKKGAINSSIFLIEKNKENII
jgi:hypothetical protein